MWMQMRRQRHWNIALAGLMMAALPLLGTSGWTDDDHKEAPRVVTKEVRDAAEAVAGAAKKKAGEAAGKAKSAAKQAANKAAAEAESTILPANVSFFDAVFGHAHNKLVHFPLAFGLLGGFLLLGTRLRSSWLGPARAMLWLAALSAIAAAITGDMQEDHVKEALHETVEWHERAGIGAAVLLWLSLTLTYIEKARPWLWLMGILVMVELSVVGFLGGVVAHP